MTSRLKRCLGIFNVVVTQDRLLKGFVTPWMHGMTAKLVAEFSSSEVLRGKVSGFKQLRSRKTYPRFLTFLALESEEDGQQSALVSKGPWQSNARYLVGKRGFTITTNLPLNAPVHSIDSERKLYRSERKRSFSFPDIYTAQMISSTNRFQNW